MMITHRLNLRRHLSPDYSEAVQLQHVNPLLKRYGHFLAQAIPTLHRPSECLLKLRSPAATRATLFRSA